MRGSYVVKRQDVFHFRIAVPADLIATLGQREVHSSLHEGRPVQARMLASALALKSLSFFHQLRDGMQRLSPEQVSQLIADWRSRMWQRDAVVRRYVESGLSAHSLDSYAQQCEGTSSVYDDLLERVSPMPAARGLHSLGVRREATSEERDSAYADAAVAMTVEPPEDGIDSTDDLVPLLTDAAYADLDALSQRDLAKEVPGRGLCRATPIN